MAKTCTHCKKTKPLTEYHKYKRSSDGVRSRCKSCRRVLEKSDPLYKKKHYKNNKDKYINQAITYYNDNKETRRIQIKTRYEKIKFTPENRNQKKLYAANRRAALFNRTPVWADLNKINEIYTNCPEGYHVDHIIPLRGKYISGLHIPENLQYLTAEENLKKSNKFGEL